MPSRAYIAIDLKSFYASVECADRQLDLLTSKIVVAETLGVMQGVRMEGYLSKNQRY